MMKAVWMVARAELHRRWRSVAVLTLLVAVAGGVVLALAAGARRTSTALGRFEAYSRSADLEMTVGSATDEQISELERSPGVRTVGRLRQLTLVPRGTRAFLPTAAQEDTVFGTAIDRPLVVRGRLADQAAVDELVIGESLAERLRLDVGDRITFDSYTPAQIEAGRAGDPLLTADGPSVALRIVGIVRRPLDLGGRGSQGGVVVPTRAFLERYRDEIGSFSGTVLRVRADGDAGAVAEASKAARRIFGGTPDFQLLGLGIEGQGAQNAIDVTTVALVIAAVIAALVALVSVSLALSREIAVADADQLTLRSLGMSPRRRALAAALVAGPVAVVGAALAVVISIAASPLFPIGVARRAEIDTGLRVDALVLLAGFVVVFAGVGAVAALAGWRTACVAKDSQATRRASAARFASSLGMPAPASIGIRSAVDRERGARGVPVWSALVAAAVGAAVVVAVGLFGASLDHLVSTPAAYGWTWDYVASDTQAQDAGTNCSDVQTRLTKMRGVDAVASICTLSLDIGGRPVIGWGYTDLRGRVEPAIVRGRAPRTDDEVALVADTLSASGREIGDSVLVEGEGGRHTYRIVGQAVFSYLADPTPLADGAAFTGNGAAHLDGPAPSTGSWDLVVRFAPDVPPAVALARLDQVRRPDSEPLGKQVPAEIDRIEQIDRLPIAVAAFVAVVALLAVGFMLVAAVRRRRRELAILKTLGFRRRQVAATVAWHATTVGVIALVVGIPLGLVIGRLLWRAVANELGVSTDPTWPFAAIVILVPVVIVAVNLVAWFPARRAAHTRPAVVLRSE